MWCSGERPYVASFQLRNKGTTLRNVSCTLAVEDILDTLRQFNRSGECVCVTQPLIEHNPKSPLVSSISFSDWVKILQVSK